MSLHKYHITTLYTTSRIDEHSRPPSLHQHAHVFQDESQTQLLDKIFILLDPSQSIFFVIADHIVSYCFISIPEIVG